MKQLQRIRAITLDLDDTLWAIGPVIRRAEEKLWSWLNEHYPNIRKRWTTDALMDLRTQVMQEHPDRSHDLQFMRMTVLTHIAVDAGYSSDVADDAFAVFFKARNEVELFPDVVPALELLADRYALVAVTNGNADLGSIGLRHLFDDVVTAVDVGAAKPAPVIFDEAVQRAGVAHDETLHVGDHPEFDIAGANAAGLRTAWINRNESEWPEHLAQPDLTVTTVSELSEALFSHAKRES